MNSMKKHNKLIIIYHNECRTAPIVAEASFINNNPWMIPINVSNLSASSFKLVNLPKVLIHREYQLGGFNLFSPGHYTAVPKNKDCNHF